MGRDKATMPHPRQPAVSMVEHTLGVLARRCAPLFVVAAPGQVLPALDA
ncbi:MAG: molybdenum cofactor guanylyltransferase, partial [Mycobacterium sp.]